MILVILLIFLIVFQIHISVYRFVLYVSTEISEFQLKERLEITEYKFKPNSFFFVQKDDKHRLCIRDDLLLDLKEFSETYNGRFVIIDIMCGIDYGY